MPAKVLAYFMHPYAVRRVKRSGSTDFLNKIEFSNSWSKKNESETLFH